MKGLAQIGVLAADRGPARRQLGVNECAQHGDDAAGHPHAQDERGSMQCCATTYGLMKMPAPTMPPITIMVASNNPT